MALSRRSARINGSYWPGFVDAITALLMVLIFVLTIFMVVQSMLRDTITSQDSKLDELSVQLAQLADALGLERARGDRLQTEVGSLTATLAQAQATGEAQAAQIATLMATLTAREADLAEAGARIASFESQVLALMAERDAALGEGARLSASVQALEAEQTRLMTEQEAMQLALAQARAEIDEGAEQARLAAAQREALEALIIDLRAKGDAQTVALSELEAARLVEAAAAQALRDRLENAQTELTAMTLALEEQRKRAEETLAFLAAANAARDDLDIRLAAALLAKSTTEAELAAVRASATDATEIQAQLAAALAARLAAETAADEALTKAEERAALLAAARAELDGARLQTTESTRQLALLNEQAVALRAQLSALQSLLDAAEARSSDNRLQMENLGSQLNAALAQVAAEQKRRAELEEAERKRLEAEAQQLEKFRSEFFGQLRQVLDGREGVRIVGDRFVFSSEVLFTIGSADLAPEGRAQIARVAEILRDVAADIPQGLDWVLRVDGHTDNVPLSGTGQFRDNWALSQARALSVVRFLQDDLGFPANRMAPTGFGEHHPVAEGNAPEARAQNRRIELKLTER
jgi:chemotaxis protein MotB